MAEQGAVPSARPMLNAYPDSLGGRLSDAVALLRRPELRGVFDSFYVLPSLFHSDLDRGFSVIDYGLEESLAREGDLADLRADGVGLMLDLVLNHCSVASPQFQDLLRHGDASRYRDFFVDWNAFWDGHGEMTADGYVQPDAALLEHMFFRKPGLPILMVRFPDGRELPFWNTFYQEVVDDASGRRYRGQMDVDVRSPLVWEFYDETLRTLAGYGAALVRLDAFAYAPKAPGRRNFLNDPETWELLARVRRLADAHGVALLPEIHASYAEGTHERIAEQGYLTYDFFLPGLVLDALETRSAATLESWARELVDKGIRTVSMLGCHDGIPLLDLEGLVPAERIEALIDTVVARGGHVKSLHGQRQVYYQVNATYFSALGEDPAALLLARAIHLFMPGKPQVWYLDLFAGTNDHEAVTKAGPGGHKEINRTNLTLDDVECRLDDPVVRDQLTLLRYRSDSPAFGFDARLEVLDTPPDRLALRWSNGDAEALLEADLRTRRFTVTDGRGGVVLAR